MKILIFEYINGGGFVDSELPASMAREGWLMLNAALADFMASGEHELSVLLDARCLNAELPAGINRIAVSPEADVLAVFTEALQNCDAVLPIAPETAQILWTFCARVEAVGKRLLSSPASAVAKTADKMTTFEILSAHHIATIPSQRFSKQSHFYEQGTVIKARDGVGCEQCFVCRYEDDFIRLLNCCPHPEHYLIQPFVEGDALSVSALFNKGAGQLLCVNRQLLSIEEQQFKLLACEVNCGLDKAAFQIIVDQIAQVFPDLWGYVGIDVIQQNAQLLVVEINPRLTSSYAGIRTALGINVGELVLQLLTGEAQIMPTINQTIVIKTS